MSERNEQSPPLGRYFERRVPEGDTLERYICGQCGHIYYSNPKIIVGSVVEFDGRVLLCKRAIAPRKNYWTLPAGFLEEHETPEEGARREAREEAKCDITLEGLLAVYTIAHISQIHLMYRARLKIPDFAPGYESLETKLFAWDQIPWDELAFPSVRWALNHFRAVRGTVDFAPFANPASESGGPDQSGL